MRYVVCESLLFGSMRTIGLASEHTALAYSITLQFNCPFCRDDVVLCGRIAKSIVNNIRQVALRLYTD